MHVFEMFITAVCLIFSIKLRWPKTKSCKTSFLRFLSCFGCLYLQHVRNGKKKLHSSFLHPNRDYLPLSTREYGHYREPAAAMLHGRNNRFFFLWEKMFHCSCHATWLPSKTSISHFVHGNKFLPECSRKKYNVARNKCEPMLLFAIKLFFVILCTF